MLTSKIKVKKGIKLNEPRCLLTPRPADGGRDPLFAFGGKRVPEKMFLPSLPLAEERVIERSDDRVSNRRHVFEVSLSNQIKSPFMKELYRSY